MTRKTLLLLVGLLLVFCVGCAAAQDADSPPVQEPNELSTPGGAVRPADNEPSDADAEEPGESAGWQTARVSEHPAFTTDDWTSFEPVDSVVPFSIDIPDHWEFGGTVLMDKETGLKVAEFAPGVVLLKQGQEPVVATGWNDIALLSEEEVRVGASEGVKAVREVQVDDPDVDSWFVTTYYLRQDTARGFVMSFFALERSDENARLYEEVMATLRID